MCRTGKQLIDLPLFHFTAMIIGAIVSEIYPVRLVPGVSRQSLLPDLESRLDQWYITLPDELRYDASNKKQVPPPQILFLHVRYWGAVLLLHRALYVTFYMRVLFTCVMIDGIRIVASRIGKGKHLSNKV